MGVVGHRSTCACELCLSLRFGSPAPGTKERPAPAPRAAKSVHERRPAPPRPPKAPREPRPQLGRPAPECGFCVGVTGGPLCPRCSAQLGDFHGWIRGLLDARVVARA
jgi:hypothetical protein